MTRFGWIVKTILFYAAIPLMIALNWFLFRRFAHKNYLVWYLENGSIISLATTFFKVFVKMEEHQEGLISAHPLRYMSECFQIPGLVLFSFGAIGRTPVGKRDASRTSWGAFWDNLSGIIVLPLVAVLMILWLIIVVPLNYLVTLVGGSPARRSLRFASRLVRPVRIKKETGGYLLANLDAGAEIPKDAEDLSFRGTPFELTQALNAILLWVAKLVYVHFA